MERVVRTSDGRTLAVEETGDLDGHPVLVSIGTPNSRRLYSRNVADAAGCGLRLISYDRPGYGGSAPHPGRTIADCVEDVRAICATLGIDRLAMWGISGGGPHVLACAALLPGLVVAAASLASPAPYGAEGLDWFMPLPTRHVGDRGRSASAFGPGRAHPGTARRSSGGLEPTRSSGQEQLEHRALAHGALDMT